MVKKLPKGLSVEIFSGVSPEMICHLIEAVRKHKLKNSARIHTGEMEEVECDAFCNFLMSKNYFLVDELRGCENA